MSLVYALDPRNGSQTWRQSLTNLPVPAGNIPPDTANAAAFHNGVIYLATDYGAAALNASSGELLWHDEQVCQCSFGYSTVTWTPQAILVQGGDASGIAGNTGIPSVSYLLAVDPVTGKALWNNFNSAQSDDYSAISTALGLYAVTASSIDSLNPANGKVFWSIPLSHIDGGANSITQWCIGPADLVLVTGPTGGDLVALNAQLGTQLWQYQSTDSITALAVGDSGVYALGSTEVEAFSPDGGRLLWRQHQPDTYPDLQVTTFGRQVLVTNSQVAVGGPPACAIINASNGKQLWTSDTNNCAFLYVS
jgi:outer membrane protein assembly factor BamB